MRKIHKYSNQSGYTVIEVMVTLGLMLVVGLGIAQMVRGAGDSASKVSKQVKQNGELRNAMDTLQQSISNADRPPLKIELKTNSSNQTIPEGNQLIYNRTEDRGSGQVNYLVERVYFNDDNSDGTGDLLIQRKSFPCDTGCTNSRQAAITSQVLTDPTSSSSGWKNAPSKLLLSNAQIPTGKSLFAYYAKAGIPSTITDGQLDKYSLVDINLQRDEDGAGSNFKAASLLSTVYLRKIGTSSTTGGGVGC